MVSDKFEEENKTKKQVYNKVVNNTLWNQSSWWDFEIFDIIFQDFEFWKWFDKIMV
jgi:hypothetical protein